MADAEKLNVDSIIARLLEGTFRNEYLVWNSGPELVRFVLTLRLVFQSEVQDLGRMSN